MPEFSVRTRGLGKEYTRGARKASYRTLRDSISEMASRVVSLGRNGGASAARSAPASSNKFWALRDINLEVKPGDVVGIIGRNGAGKSTLLKILSRITDPTEGVAEIAGRVGCLLEVGTGFHSELTGRENIVLSGAILGMQKAEIDERFEEIVNFADVTDFIDMPVKHYSSGMYLRLAFSVAAHLRPSVLIVDEVLAVGDASFQKKCLGRMNEVAKEGRTVLFVSHNLEAVLSLCTRCVLLDQGEILADGDPLDIVNRYHALNNPANSQSAEGMIWNLPPDSSGSPACIERIEILDESGQPITAVHTWDHITIRLHYCSERTITHGSFVLDFRDYKDQRLIVLDSGTKVQISPGRHTVDCSIPNFPLSAGEYYLSCGIAHSRTEWLWRRAQSAQLNVCGKDVFSLGRPPVYARMLVAAIHDWSSASAHIA